MRDIFTICERSRGKSIERHFRMATNVMNSQLPHIVSRGHTRTLTEINFVEDGPDRTLLVSSAHDKLPQLRNGRHSVLG